MVQKILILGGSNFIGRNLIEKLIEQKSFDLTISNRGKTNTNLFPEIKRVTGNRNEIDFAEKLKGDWDYVMDCSCYFPKTLGGILKAVAPGLKKYIFISTCSVYQSKRLINRDERAAIKSCSEEEFNELSLKHYGKHKAKCEEIIRKSGVNFTIFRPALVYGQYDNTDRFYYWLHQVFRYDEIMIPNEGIQKISLTYVDDLIDLILRSINEKEEREIYNTTSFPLKSISAIIETAAKILDKTPKLISVPSIFLKKNEISEWTDLPLWIDSNYFTFSNEKLLRTYDFQPINFRKSIAQTILYYQALNWPDPTYGIKRSRQVNLLKSV